MLALQVTELSGPDGLEAVEVDDPVPGAGMVLIDVHAAGVGFVDLLLTRGEYQIKPELPFVPGLEVAGIVADAALEPGMRVAAVVPFGGFAERAVAPAARTATLIR